MHSGPLASISTPKLLFCAGICLLVAVVGALLIAPHNRLPGRHGAELPIPVLGNSPILQVELARNEDDLRRVLMVGDNENNLRDATEGNRLDTFLFIPAYTGLLFLTGMLLTRTGSRLARVVFLLSVLAVPAIAVCDWMENLGIAKAIAHISQDGGPHDGDAVRISTPSFVKWALISAVLLIYGAAAAATKPQVWRLALALVLLATGLRLAITLSRYAWLRYGSGLP